MNQNPYSFEEKAKLMQNGNAMKFVAECPEDWTIGRLRGEVRKRFLAPPTLQDKLQLMLDELEGDHRITPAARDLIKEAGKEINRAARRPIEDLRQEAFGPGRDSSPYRWVILWGPSGYVTTPWRCEVGRRAPSDYKFAGRFVDHSGECFTDGGEDATHFSELPLDV